MALEIAESKVMFSLKIVFILSMSERKTFLASSSEDEVERDLFSFSRALTI